MNRNKTAKIEETSPGGPLNPSKGGTRAAAKGCRRTVGESVAKGLRRILPLLGVRGPLLFPALRLLAVAALIVTVAAAPVRAQDTDTVLIPTQPPAKPATSNQQPATDSSAPPVVTLPGGTRLITLYEPRAPLVTMDVFFRAGTPDESGNEGGIAALIARAWFGETGGRTDRLQQIEIERQGGGVGAVAWGELTELWSVSGADEASLDAAARTLLFETVGSPQFSDKTVEEARTDLLRDLALNADNPGEATLAALKKRAWSFAPYGSPAGGTPESLARITPAMMRRFYARYFRPNRAVVVVAGNITPEAARALVKNNLGGGGWTDGKPAPKPPTFATEQISPNLRPLSLARGGQAGTVAVGYVAPGTENNGKNYATLLLLDAVLGGGKSARLFRDLRDGGVNNAAPAPAPPASDSGTPSPAAPSHATLNAATDPPPAVAASPGEAATPPVGYDIRTTIQAGTGQSLWVVYATGARDALTVEAAVKRELASLADGSRPVTDAELTRARAFLSRERLQSRQRLKSRAFRTGWAEAMGLGYEWETDFDALLATLTADDVNRLARQLFNAPAATVSSR